jgi:hypothetical protein
MSCDIHATIERKKYWNWATTRPNETGLDYTWINAGDPDTGQHYYLFAMLGDAGRNYYNVPPISKDRGFPVRDFYIKNPSAVEDDGEVDYYDICREFAAYEREWRPDAHHHGYVTLTELRAYQPERYFPPEAMKSLRPSLDNLLREMERVADRYDGDGDAVRIVFFFDN